MADRRASAANDPGDRILDSTLNLVPAFRNGLSETGYVAGRNVADELRATRQWDLLPATAAELVRLRVASAAPPVLW